MKMRYAKVLTFLFVLGLCACAVEFLSRPVNSEIASVSNDTGNEVIAGYKQWTRVNEEPQNVAARIAAQCADPTVMRGVKEQNPHRDKFVVVYVNDIGRPAMMEQKVPHFPLGSVIVKEKLSTKESSSPELLTVMRKRKPGYDLNKGDWEYMVFDGTAKVLQASGKLEKCQACHQLEEKTDYIARTYLSHELWQKLK
jgi:Cytochrome P460